MTKAYDLQALAEKLKSKGLPIALEAGEEAAKQVYIAVKEWAVESAALSETKVDDLVAPFYGHLDQIVLPLVDKIDGEVG